MIVPVYPKDGILYVKAQLADSELASGEDFMLVYFYSGGDVDTFGWPIDTAYRSDEVYNEQLQAALYDAREMGVIPARAAEYELPDGRILRF